MGEILIRSPKFDEIDKLNIFFERVLKDTFIKNHVMHLKKEYEIEIEDKNKIICRYFDENKEDNYFFIAIVDGRVVGSISLAYCNKMIIDALGGGYKRIYELGTIFVDPDYQGIGIGSKLIEHGIELLKSIGVEKFCLDSGYKSAQRIWNKKFGKSERVFKDFFDKGNDYIIWIVDIKKD